jgi:lysophospholipid acyltransferase (LPLAT)-like uncharacterized protein
VGVAGWLLGWIVWLWLRTLRVQVIEDAPRDETRPWVLVFFHGTQVPLLAWKRRRTTAVLVSLSKDGALQSKVMTRAGMRVVRGSSSRRGARGLLEMVRAMRRDGSMDAAFAVDGPKGPYGSIQPGAAACARAIDGVIVPMGSACARAKVLTRAWDRMALPLPFSRVAVVIGAPLHAEATPERIRAAIDDVNARAASAIAEPARATPAATTR